MKQNVTIYRVVIRIITVVMVVGFMLLFPRMVPIAKAAYSAPQGVQPCFSPIEVNTNLAPSGAAVCNSYSPLETYIERSKRLGEGNGTNASSQGVRASNSAAIQSSDWISREEMQVLSSVGSGNPPVIANAISFADWMPREEMLVLSSVGNGNPPAISNAILFADWISPEEMYVLRTRDGSPYIPPK